MIPVLGNIENKQIHKQIHKENRLVVTRAWKG